LAKQLEAATTSATEAKSKADEERAALVAQLEAATTSATPIKATADEERATLAARLEAAATSATEFKSMADEERAALVAQLEAATTSATSAKAAADESIAALTAQLEAAETSAALVKSEAAQEMALVSSQLVASKLSEAQAKAKAHEESVIFTAHQEAAKESAAVAKAAAEGATAKLTADLESEQMVSTAARIEAANERTMLRNMAAELETVMQQLARFEDELACAKVEAAETKAANLAKISKMNSQVAQVNADAAAGATTLLESEGDRKLQHQKLIECTAALVEAQQRLMEPKDRLDPEGPVAVAATTFGSQLVQLGVGQLLGLCERCGWGTHYEGTLDDLDLDDGALAQGARRL
jgi:hypothetical protein